MPSNSPPKYPKPPAPPAPPEPPMSYINSLRPRSYFVSALTCLYCGRVPTGQYDNCDYCGALVRRGQRVDVTTIQDKAPRYIEVER